MPSLDETAGAPANHNKDHATANIPLVLLACQFRISPGSRSNNLRALNNGARRLASALVPMHYNEPHVPSLPSAERGTL